MSDPRIVKQAEVLVNQSIKLKKGDNVIIATSFEAKPLVYEIYKLLIQKGAGQVRISFDDEILSEIYYKNASPTQIKSFPSVYSYEMKKMDCYIRISAPTNSKALTSVDPKVISERQKVIRPILDYRVDNTRWVVTRFPTASSAQDAEMSLTEYEDFVFGAINKVDWKKKFVEQEKLRKLVDKTDKVRIIAPGTDLRFSIRGRKADNAGGECNMPDGEVFTSVIENSAEGVISYTYPAIYMSKEFLGVILEFKSGKVVKATAEKGESDLNKILDTDKGARFIGEFGIGNNYAIGRFTKDILFDEKIGGSIHLALGKGYKKTLSKNSSAIHWDMICDLRNKGELYFDERLVQKNGKWLV